MSTLAIIPQRRHWVAWVVCATVWWGGVGRAAAEPTPGYTSIQRAFLREDFEEVASLAQLFLQQHPEAPEWPRVQLWRALSLDRSQRAHEALLVVDQLKARLQPGHPLWAEVLFWEGEISRLSFQMVRAKLSYLRLLEQYPDSIWASQAHLGVGIVYAHFQAFEVAVQHFHEVALRQAGTPVALDALLLQGLCHLQLRQFQEAVVALEPLLDQLEDPTIIGRAAFYLGEGFSGLGRYAAAARAYRQAIDAAEESQWGSLAYFGLGWACYKLDRCEESVEVFERYLTERAAAGHRTEALFAQGSCLLRLGKERQALRRFEEIVSRDPQHTLALESGLMIVDAYRREEHFDLAKALLHTLLQHHPDPLSRAQVQLPLAAIALGQGNAAQARTIYELAAQSEELAIRQPALNGLGDVQMFLGDIIAAKRHYEEAVRVAPDSPRATYAWYQIGRIHMQLGALEDAVGVFQRLAAHPDPIVADDARLALVIAYLNRRDDALARPLLAAIRQERPAAPAAGRAAYYAALLALDEEDEGQAQQLCQEAVTKAADTEEGFEARLLLVELQHRAGSPRDVMAALEQVSHSSDLLRSHRAKLAKRLGDLARDERAYPQAVAWYQEAARLLPSLASEATYRIASCYEEEGDLEEAAAWYQHVPHAPWRVRGLLAAAKLLQRQDRLNEAEAIYERVAAEPIPEAKLVKEWLAALRE
jgi:tetratricopeptide (TPR) repeat protein